MGQCVAAAVIALTLTVTGAAGYAAAVFEPQTALLVEPGVVDQEEEKFPALAAKQSVLQPLPEAGPARSSRKPRPRPRPRSSSPQPGRNSPQRSRPRSLSRNSRPSRKPRSLRPRPRCLRPCPRPVWMRKTGWAMRSGSR